MYVLAVSCIDCMVVFTAAQIADRSSIDWESVQIKEQTPELGKLSHVVKLSLDKAYDYALDPQLSKIREGVTIRFMPDAQQVKHALAVFFLLIWDVSHAVAPY